MNCPRSKLAEMVQSWHLKSFCDSHLSPNGEKGDLLFLEKSAWSTGLTKKSSGRLHGRCLIQSAIGELSPQELEAYGLHLVPQAEGYKNLKERGVRRNTFQFL